MTNAEIAADVVSVIQEQVNSISNPNSKLQVLSYYIYKLHDMKIKVMKSKYEEYSLCPFCNDYYKKNEIVIETNKRGPGILDSKDTHYDEIYKYCPKCGRELSHDIMIRKEFKNTNDTDPVN